MIPKLSLPEASVKTHKLLQGFSVLFKISILKCLHFFCFYLTEVQTMPLANVLQNSRS